MKVWILGAGGGLGVALIDYCSVLRIPFVASKHRDVDITNLEQLKRVAEKIKCTHLINCAAYTDVDGAEKNSKEAFSVNASGPENLGILAAEFPMQVIQVSTDYVFDGNKGSAYVETDTPSPLGVYGRSKYEGELRLLEHLQSACIVRTSWIFGLQGKNFISNILPLLRSKAKIQVIDDQIGRATYNRDLAHALVDLCCHSGIYHYANSEPMSRYQIACDFLNLAKQTGVPVICEALSPISYKLLNTPSPRPIYSVLDTKKTELVLGRKSRDWNVILEEYFSHA